MILCMVWPDAGVCGSHALFWLIEGRGELGEPIDKSVLILIKYLCCKAIHIEQITHSRYEDL